MTTYIELARKQHELQTKYEQIKNHYTKEESLLMFEVAAYNKQLKQMQKIINTPIVRNKNDVENPLKLLMNLLLITDTIRYLLVQEEQDLSGKTIEIYADENGTFYTHVTNGQETKVNSLATSISFHENQSEDYFNSLLQQIDQLSKKDIQYVGVGYHENMQSLPMSDDWFELYGFKDAMGAITIHISEKAMVLIELLGIPQEFVVKSTVNPSIKILYRLENNHYNSYFETKQGDWLSVQTLMQ